MTHNIKSRPALTTMKMKFSVATAGTPPSPQITRSSKPAGVRAASLIFTCSAVDSGSRSRKLAGWRRSFSDFLGENLSARCAKRHFLWQCDRMERRTDWRILRNLKATTWSWRAFMQTGGLAGWSMCSLQRARNIPFQWGGEPIKISSTMTFLCRGHTQKLNLKMENGSCPTINRSLAPLC